MQQTELPPAPPAPPAKKRKRWPWVLGVVGIIALITVVGSMVGGNDDAPTTEPATGSDDPALNVTRFEEATMGITNQHIEVTDDGSSIIMDGPYESEYLPGAGKKYIQSLAIVLANLDTPDYVIEQMESTTSLMGVREASWDGIDASWSYHPDNGFDLVLVDTEA